MEGVSAMNSHRAGRVTLRPHQIERLTLPPIDEQIIRSARERLHTSRPAFADRIGVNPQTLGRWEQGRSKPNDQAAMMTLLQHFGHELAVAFPDAMEFVRPGFDEQ